MRVMNKPFNIFEYPYMCFVTFVIHLNRKIENIEILNFDSYADIHWAYVRTYVHAIHTYIPTYIYTYNSGSSRSGFLATFTHQMHGSEVDGLSQTAISGSQ